MEDAEQLPVTEPADDEPDWFGETSPFDSEAHLAAALPDLLLQTPRHGDDSPPPPPTAPPDEQPLHVPEQASPSAEDHYFEVMQRRDTTLDGTIVVSKPSLAAPAWSVRTPGVEPLPQREPGRSGWSIVNSVRILRRAEDLVMRLRQEAVVAAFNAAARALHGED